MWSKGWAVTALCFCLAPGSQLVMDNHVEGSLRGHLQVIPAQTLSHLQEAPQLGGAEMKCFLCAHPNSGPMESVNLIKGPCKSLRFGVICWWQTQQLEHTCTHRPAPSISAQSLCAVLTAFLRPSLFTPTVPLSSLHVLDTCRSAGKQAVDPGLGSG